MSKGDAILGRIAIVSDVMAALGIPGTSTFQLAVSNALERRKREAIDLLIAEVAKGKREGVEFTNGEAAELVQMLLRFSSAVDAGAARQNLGLLAQVIFGLKRNKTFEYDKFSKWANILQTLTRNEILFLGAAYHLMNEKPDDFWKKIKESLSSNFLSNECDQIAAALTRTGLILPMSAWGGMAYIASPALKELGQLAALEPTSNDR
ncbi:MAG: hypothetical protein ACT4O2_04410 [Beijerinckiaceae bacterium]